MWSDCEKLLCKTDTEFVDVIHTDDSHLGYADYYLHGGMAPQRGCDMCGIIDAGNFLQNISLKKFKLHSKNAICV